MADQSTNYDDVKQYRLDPEREQELINSAGECVFIWSNKAGHPIGVITAYVPVDGKIWMTATRAGMHWSISNENLGFDPRP